MFQSCLHLRVLLKDAVGGIGRNVGMLQGKVEPSALASFVTLPFMIAPVPHPSVVLSVFWD